jgi:hypothetical protein
MQIRPSGRHRRAGSPVRAVLRLVTAAGLVIDAYVHAHLADRYDEVAKSISQGDLFRIEAGLASLAALLVLVWRRPTSTAFAFLVAAGGLFALVLYRYVDVGTLGPLPNMYEPVWTGDKVLVAVSQAVAAVTSAVLLVGDWRARGSRS